MLIGRIADDPPASFPAWEALRPISEYPSIGTSGIDAPAGLKMAETLEDTSDALKGFAGPREDKPGSYPLDAALAEAGVTSPKVKPVGPPDGLVPPDRG